MSQDALRITTRKEGSNEAGEIAFLCHNTADKAFVRSIADALELEFGTRFFLDVFAIPSGEQFIPWIESALADCAVCAIFLGANGWGPTHLWEAELALNRYRRDPNFRLIPVALPGLTNEEAAKLGSGKLFQEDNWADFTKGPNDRDSLEKLEFALTGKSVASYRGPARLTPYQIRRDADRWKRSREADVSILYGGRQLEDAEAILRDNPDMALVAGVASFLSASRGRQSCNWRRLAIGSIVSAVILVIATSVAIVSYFVAEQRRLASESRQLAIASREAMGADRALVIAARALLVADTPEARAALLDRLQEFRFLERIVRAGGYVEDIAMGQNGALMLGTSVGLQTLPLNGNVASEMAGSNEAVTAVLASDSDIWIGRDDGRVDAFGAKSELIQLLPPAKLKPGRELRVRSLAGNKSKGFLAVGTGAGRITIVRTSDRSIVKELDEGDRVRVNSLSFNPKGPRLAVGTSDGSILLIDTESLRVVRRYPHIEGGVLSLGYVADGSLVAVSGEGRLFYFDVRSPELEKPTAGDIVPLATAAPIDAATSRVAVGDFSGTVRMYDASTGKGTGDEPLKGHSDAVTAIGFGPESKTTCHRVFERHGCDLGSWQRARAGGSTAPIESLPFRGPRRTRRRHRGCVLGRGPRRDLASQRAAMEVGCRFARPHEAGR